jgi:phage shock protein PspC (stress-responsive transcriptional regulator)
MTTLEKYIKNFFERQAFGVCEWWGEKLGIQSSKVRVYFIYISFITLGSPFIIYLFFAFWLEHKDVFKRKARPTVWDI